MTKHTKSTTVTHHRKKRYPYKILHFLSSHERFIDFKKSSFYMVDYLGVTKQRIYIRDEKEYYLECHKFPSGYALLASKFYIIEEHKIDIDLFKIHLAKGKIFLKQNLVDALRSNSITGIDFEPITQPILRHIRWADTGLPVED